MSTKVSSVADAAPASESAMDSLLLGRTQVTFPSLSPVRLLYVAYTHVFAVQQYFCATIIIASEMIYDA